MGYTRQTVLGMGWHSVFQLTTKILVAGKTIILARLLAPNDIGLFSLTTIALGLTEAFTETGVNITLIQSPKKISYYLDTAWVIAIIRGTIIGLIMVGLAMVMQLYYGEAQLLPLVTLAAFVPFVKGFINPTIVSLQKSFAFRHDSWYRISLVVVEATTTVGLSYIFRSPFVLVIGMLVSALFEVGLSFWLFKERPRFQFEPSRAKDILAQAKWLSLSSVLNYLHENIDNLLIGKLTNTTSLGYYHYAYNTAHTGNYDLSKSIGHTTLPVFARIADDRRRLKRAFWKSRVLSLLGLTAISLPLFLFPQLIVIVFGDKWAPSMPLVRPLIIAGLCQSAALLTYTLFLVKKQYRMLNMHLGLTVGLLVALVIGLTPRYGLMGAVWGVTLSRAMTLPLLWWGIKRAFKP